MTKDLEALCNLSEEQIRHSYAGDERGETIVALILELRQRNRTMGEQCANAVWMDLIRREHVTITWSHPQVAEALREWAKIIDAKVSPVVVPAPAAAKPKERVQEQVVKV